MSMIRFNPFKETLSEDEQRYVDDRNDLRLERERRAEAKRLDPDDEVEPDEEEEEGLPVEEWVKQASDEEIKAELDQMQVKYAPNAKRETLQQKLVEAVQAAR